MGPRLEGARWQVEDLTPEQGLELAVDAALEHGVDAVLFAGDVVESMQDRFAAVGPLEVACARLLERGIPVFAVAGNHDVEALPTVVQRLKGALKLLGAGGSWEAATVSGADGTTIRVLGRSFAQRIERASPMSLLDGEELWEPQLPTVGLLHCDLDQPGSPHAPVARRELDSGSAGRCAAWLLGHIHKPSLPPITGPGAPAPPVGYLGSLVALDAGEPGPHGPWLVEVGAEGVEEARQIPLSPVRFEALEVACADLVTDPAELLHWTAEQAQDAVVDRLHSGMRALLERCTEEQPTLRVLSVRATFTGAVGSPAMRSALVWLQREPDLQQVGGSGTAIAVCERVEDAFRPVLDLAQLKAEAGPLGELATILLEVEEDTDTGRRLVAEFVADEFDRQLRQGPWRSGLEVGEHPEPPPDPRDVLLQTTRNLLAELHGARLAAAGPDGGNHGTDGVGGGTS